MRRAHVLWFTGLSGSGKSTIANGVRQQLESEGRAVLVIDGDAVRRELHRHLGFSEAGIKENNRLIAQLCATHRAAVEVILVPIISPYAAVRAEVRVLLEPGFSEVYCDASLACVTRRDVKGLYAKAARGAIVDMIGCSPERPYEPPVAPDITVRTEIDTVDQSIEQLTAFVREALARHERDLRGV